MQFNAILFSLLMLVILSSSSFALPSEKESAWTNYWGDKSAHKPAASSESTQSTASKGKQEWQDVNQRPATSTYPTSYKSSQGETACKYQKILRKFKVL